MVYAGQEFGRLKCSPGGDLTAKPADFGDKTPIYKRLGEVRRMQ